MEAHFETLNIKPGATIGDVKAAYRRLAKKYHPDSAGPGGDAGRFYQVHEAYRSLLKELHGRRERQAPSIAGYDGPTAPVARAGLDWRFEGVTDDGPNVVYVIRVAPDAADRGLKLILPWKAEDACPRCLGEGHTLSTVFGGTRLMRVRCDKCGGYGLVRHNSTVQLDLSPDMIRQGRVRMKNLGHYNPTRGARGDLVIEFRLGETGPGALFSS
jgi:DnaJ-class molecular chaperone